MRGVHKTTQTAFRIPEGFLAWLRAQARLEQRTMTAVILDALRAYQHETTARCTAPIPGGGHPEGCWHMNPYVLP